MGALLTNMSPERPETPDMPDIGPAGVSGAAMAGADTSSSSLKSPAPARREGQPRPGGLADLLGRRTLDGSTHGFFLVLIMWNHSLLRNVGEYASGARLAISTKPTDLILKATLVHGGNARW